MIYASRLKIYFSKHWKAILIILIIALFNVVIRVNFFPLTSTSDSYSYVETGKLLIGQNGEVFANRILKPLAPLGIGLLSYLTGGDWEKALLIEAIIFYLLMAVAAYLFFESFLTDSRKAILASLLYISAYPMLKYGLNLFTETGSQFFVLLGFAGAIYFYRNPTKLNIYITSFIVAIGLLWKEYSAVAGAFLLIVLYFHPLLDKKDKLKNIARFALVMILTQGICQLIIYYFYHYTYFDWYVTGGIPDESQYNPYYIGKSLFALLLPAWILFPFGLARFKQFSLEQKYWLKCLILPSFMFLGWGFVSSRLYFVAAPLFILILINALDFFKRKKIWSVFIFVIYIASNYYWLFISDSLKFFLKN